MSEDVGSTTSKTGSKDAAAEKLDCTTWERIVVAGWREDTNGTASLGVGLYSPFRIFSLDLLAILARWYLTDTSSYPLATR